MSSQTFPGSYDSVERIASFVRFEAEKVEFNSKELFAIEAAVDEAVSNIIEHAYKGEGKGSITCHCTTTPESISIILEDSGSPFDPSLVPAPVLDRTLKHRKNHGLGIYMMHHWMDVVHFDFYPGCNRLTMVKYREKAK